MGEQKISDIPGLHSKTIRGLETPLIAGATGDWPLFIAEEDIEVAAVKVSFGAVILGDAVDYIRLRIVNKGTDGLKDVEIARKDFTAPVGQPYIPVDVPVNAVEANRRVGKGEAVIFVNDQINAGQQFEPCVFRVDFKYQKPPTS